MSKLKDDFELIKKLGMFGKDFVMKKEDKEMLDKIEKKERCHFDEDAFGLIAMEKEEERKLRREKKKGR